MGPAALPKTNRMPAKHKFVHGIKHLLKDSGEAQFYQALGERQVQVTDENPETR